MVKTLDGKAAFLLDLSLNVHFVALNALIASFRLGQGSEGLAAVAHNLATQSHDSMATIDGMTKQLVVLTSALRDIAFNLSTVTLQVEMTAFFLHERQQRSSRGGRTGDDVARIGTLAQSIMDSTGKLEHALPKAQDAVPQLSRLHERLTSDLHRLSCLHMLGQDPGGVGGIGRVVPRVDRTHRRAVERGGVSATRTARGHPGDHDAAAAVRPCGPRRARPGGWLQSPGRGGSVGDAL